MGLKLKSIFPSNNYDTKNLNKQDFFKLYDDIRNRIPVSYKPYLAIMYLILFLMHKNKSLQKELKKVIVLLRKKVNDKNRKTEYMFALGFCYYYSFVRNIFSANNLLNSKNWSLHTLKFAKQYFSLVERSSNSQIINPYLTFCNGLITDFNSVIQYVEKNHSAPKPLREMQDYFMFPSTKLISVLSILKSAQSAIIEHQNKKAVDILSILTIDEMDYFKFLKNEVTDNLLYNYFFFLFISLIRLGELNNARFVIRDWKREYPNDPKIYELLAQLFVEKAKYELASRCFKKAKELYKSFDAERYTLCDAGRLFASGMVSWQNLYKKGENTDRSYYYFEKCAKIIQNRNLEFYGDFSLLPHFIKIDKKFATLSKLKSLFSLKRKVGNLMTYICVKMKGSVVGFGVSRKKGYIMVYPSYLNLELLMSIKLHYLMFLYKSLAGIPLESDEVLTSKHGDMNENWQYRLYEFYKHILHEAKLSRCAYAFDYLKIFRERINHRQLEQIPAQERGSLLSSLNSHLLTIGEPLSLGIVSLDQEYIRRIEMNLREINEKLNKTGQELSEFKQDQKAIIPYVKEISKKTGSLASELTKEQVDTPEIIFTPEHVTVSTIRVPILKTSRERYMIEYLVLKEEIHYLYIFIILKERGVNFRPGYFISNPMSKFKKMKADLGTLLHPFQSQMEEDILPFEIVGPEKGYFKLDVKRNYKSNITEAKDLYRIALSLFNEEKIEESIKILHGKDGAIHKYFNYLDAYKLLAQCYIVLGIQNVQKQKIEEVRRFLERRFSWYEEGISTINEYFNVVKELPVSNEVFVFEKIKEERDEIHEILEQLRQIRSSKTGEDKKWAAFNELQDIISEGSLGMDDEDVINELLKSKKKIAKIMRELIGKPVENEIERLRAMRIDDAIAMDKKEEEIMLKYLMLLITLLKQGRLKRSDFPSWGDLFNYVSYHVAKSANPHNSSKHNLTIRRYVRKYLEVIEKEKLESKTYMEKMKILKKYNISKDKYLKIIKYLRKVENVPFDDERDRGKITYD